VLAPDARIQLTALLERARERGFLGPGPVETHLEHAAALAATVGPRFAGRFLDLGSGAGVPGLALALAWPEATGTLLDSRRRRCAFVEAALLELGIAGRVGVACGRAEELARRPERRGRYDLLVARGFGAPAPTAECAVGFLQAGGKLVVSEPPGEASPDRWPAEGLAELGLGGPELEGAEGARFAILTLRERAGERWPRRTGVPTKRPLWVAGG
jgi:16S rRNA (guanine527-N7)-methyltransferase